MRISITEEQKVLGLVEMTSGLVNASFSLPNWQAVKMIFFAPWPGYKENHFTACHLGKLKLSFTSPDVISSSPKALWRAELIAQFFCYSNSSKHITCPSGKLKTEFTNPITKSTSPRLLDTTFFACCTQDFTSQISNWHAIAYRENNKLGQVVKLQIKFPAEKNTLTVAPMTSNSTSDGHSQTGSQKLIGK